MTSIIRTFLVAALLITAVFGPEVGLGDDANERDKEAVRGVVRTFFDRYAKERIADLMALWDPTAPGLADRRNILGEVFASTENIALKKIEFGFVDVQGGNAKVFVTAEMAGVDVKTKEPSPYFGMLRRGIALVRSEDRWLIRAYHPLFEDIEFQRQLSLLNERRARAKFLDTWCSNEYERRMALWRAIESAPDAEARARILTDEPVVQSELTCRYFCDRGYKILDVATPSPSDLKAVGHQIGMAREAAHIIDRPLDAIWIEFYQSLIDEARGDEKTARVGFERAAESFHTFGVEHGEATALLRLARIDVRHKRISEAEERIRKAERILRGFVDVETTELPYLGHHYAQLLAVRDNIEQQVAGFLGPEQRLQALSLLLNVDGRLLGSLSQNQIVHRLQLAETQLMELQFDAARASAKTALAEATAYYGPDGGRTHEAQHLLDAVDSVGKADGKVQTAFRDAARKVSAFDFLLKNNVLPLATTAAEEGRKIYPEIVGRKHPLSLAVDVRWGQILVKQAKFKDATRLLVDAAADYIEVLGKDHPTVGAAINTATMTVMTGMIIEVIQKNQKQYVQYAELYERLAKAAAGSVDRQVNLLLVTHDEFNRVAKFDADKFEQLHQANESWTEGRGANTKGKYVEAKRSLSKAAVMFSTLLGPQSILRLTVLHELADAYLHDGKIAEAVKTQEEILTITTHIYGRATFRDYFRLGTYYIRAGKLSEALEALDRAVALYNEMPSDQIDALQAAGCAVAMSACARVSVVSGDVKQAERYTLRALHLMRRVVLPADHPLVFGPELPLDITGVKVRDQFATRTYAHLLASAAAIELLSLPPVRVTVSDEAVNQLVKAVRYARASGRILDVVDGVQDTDARIEQLSVLGRCLSQVGDLEEVRTLLARCSEMRKRLNSPHSQQSIADVICLASVELRLGNFDEAERHIAAGKQMIQESGFDLGTSLPSLWELQAVMDWRRKDLTKAWSALEQVLVSEEKVLNRLLTTVSEEQMTSLAKQTQTSVDSLLTLLLSLQDRKAEQVDTAWKWVAHRKGIVSGTVARVRSAERILQTDAKSREIAGELQQAKQREADVALRPDVGASVEQRRLQAEQLRAEIATLERSLGVRLQAAEDFEFLDFADLKRKLLPRSALIDFIRYEPYRVETLTRGPARYLAFVLSSKPDSQPHLFELGAAAEIETAVTALREAIDGVRYRLADSSEADLENEYREAARDVYRLVVTPLKSAIADAESLYVSPDGELNRVAFESLVAADDRYLVERHSFAYLTTPRDLMRKHSDKNEGAIIFADPDFDLSEGNRDTADLAQSDVLKADRYAFSGTRSFDSRGGSWKKLPGTTGEADDLGQILGTGAFSPVHKFIGPQALEEAFKRIRPPRLLHVATHGYFYEDATAPGGESVAAVSSRGSLGAAVGYGRLRTAQNPLLRSGLVLAGANRIADRPTVGGDSTKGRSTVRSDDGWLTAEEISAMDLSGTELVVLSACETGLGDIHTGQGVQGLRRAFLQAGAQAIITSLYQVPDEATRPLMVDFYRGLLAGKSKLTALREAQLGALKKRRDTQQAAHPFFWGSFILVGDSK